MRGILACRVGPLFSGQHVRTIKTSISRFSDYQSIHAGTIITSIFECFPVPKHPCRNHNNIHVRTFRITAASIPEPFPLFGQPNRTRMPFLHVKHNRSIFTSLCTEGRAKALLVLLALSRLLGKTKKGLRREANLDCIWKYIRQSQWRRQADPFAS